MRLPIACACVALVLFVGCDQTPGPVPVSGTVKFADGSIPQGEVCDVRFERSGGGGDGKMARGVISPDGGFKLTTMEPDDGAFPGDYKVVFEIYKTYIGRESLVDPQFEKIATTPVTATVAKTGPNKFDFVIKKRQ